ncbi:MAG: (Fe-S)-binding protein [Candidatus Helarchaeota archaeon]
MKNTEKTKLIKSFKIKEILPCFTTHGYIRFVAQADHEISEVIPIIFLSLPPGRTNYIISKNILTVKHYNRMITFFPSGEIGVTNTKDEKEAHEVLEKIKDLINDAYMEYLKNGKPSMKEIENVKKLSWMDLYKCLPKMNCEECGFPTCSAFAVSVLQGDAELSQCKLLKEPKYLKKLRTQFGQFYISSLGWE